MGQATADLPSTSRPTEPSGNADDLLSQLAGEEIDRLLAEADTAPGQPAQQPVVESQGVNDPEPSSDQALAAQLDTPEPAAATPAEEVVASSETPAAEPSDSPEELHAAIPSAEVDKEIADTAAAAVASKPTEDAFAAQVDELFKELEDLPETPTTPAEPIPATAAAPSASQPLPPAAPAPVSAAAEIAAELDHPTTASEERSALQQPAPSALAHSTEPADNAPPSALVRILELVNAPVQAMPDTLRDTLGKIAILTTMNALGVLLYLLLFRR